jgi:hypothetical protein
VGEIDHAHHPEDDRQADRRQRDEGDVVGHLQELWDRNANAIECP